MTLRIDGIRLGTLGLRILVQLCFAAQMLFAFGLIGTGLGLFPLLYQAADSYALALVAAGLGQMAGLAMVLVSAVVAHQPTKAHSNSRWVGTLAVVSGAPGALFYWVFGSNLLQSSDLGGWRLMAGFAVSGSAALLLGWPLIAARRLFILPP